MIFDYHYDMIGSHMNRQYFAILLLTKNYFNNDNRIHGKSEVDFECKIVGDKSPIDGLVLKWLVMSDFTQGANEDSKLFSQKYGHVRISKFSGHHLFE